MVTLAPPRTTTPSDVGVPKEEAEEGTPARAPLMAGRQKSSRLYPSGDPPAMASTLQAPLKGPTRCEIPDRKSPVR
ncbi:UNVERIFIED_CONTAM: hypothetical protein Sradi_3189100 [Sesamum radiatum]|uniref:Uncharacterized protein n=1 Tax=Sesamum radiatum TaxID=300843 RepID=A0AAW2RH70_SESRA